MELYHGTSQCLSCGVTSCTISIGRALTGDGEFKNWVSKTLPENTAPHPYYTLPKFASSYSLCHFELTFNNCFDLLCKKQATN